MDVGSKLVELGVDIINVSSGIGGWRRPRDRVGEGYLVDDAHKIQKNISAPVIGVGGIKSRDYINKKLSQASYRHPDSSEQQDPARERADIRKRWRAQLDIPRRIGARSREQGGGLGSGSSSVRRFS